MRKIRRGDEVLVISGRVEIKGQRGVVRVNHIDSDRVTIEGVNLRTKHIKRGRARQAGRVQFEAPIHVSNVKLICPSCKQPTRVGIRSNDAGKNERHCKKCSASIPAAEL
jgi:large subunit ribosomal protein L24